MPEPTELVNELQGLLKAIKGNPIHDGDVAVLEAAKAAFRKICNDNGILIEPITVNPPIKTSRSKPR
jgi:hypothetical protein